MKGVKMEKSKRIDELELLIQGKLAHFTDNKPKNNAYRKLAAVCYDREQEEGCKVLTMRVETDYIYNEEDPEKSFFMNNLIYIADGKEWSHGVNADIENTNPYGLISSEYTLEMVKEEYPERKFII